MFEYISFVLLPIAACVTAKPGIIAPVAYTKSSIAVVPLIISTILSLEYFYLTSHYTAVAVSTPYTVQYLANPYAATKPYTAAYPSTFLIKK
uniref:Uncharacterized protein n=1 Tax=Glossina palpalis gambiensis TaxID=67801 RepID=A0A1B0AY70_9MUSC